LRRSRGRFMDDPDFEIFAFSGVARRATHRKHD
jgi:hypothetical protein